MARKTIFISFDYDNDAHYKNLLLAWDKNNDFDFRLYDGSLKVAIDSNDAAYIKSKIKPIILAASHLLCIVGKYCAQNRWIDWEVNTAAAAGKSLIGVKLDGSYSGPPSLMAGRATWANSFTFDAIKRAVDSA